MKFLWTIACVLAGFDMMLVAMGGKPSPIIHAPYVWLAWFPAVGWFAAAYGAATARADWF
jgi:hypothetical protein